MLHVCLDNSPLFTWIELHEIDSTNNFLRTFRPPSPTPLTLVTAEHQTAGRGQVGNVWQSRRGENLLCSYMFTPSEDIRPGESFVVNQAIALAVRDACQEFLDDEVCVKWPNDIYVGERKLSGILIETEMTGRTINRVIAGIGINVMQTEWAIEGDIEPVSIAMLGAKCTAPYGEVAPRAVIEQLTGHLQRRLMQLSRADYEGIRADYMARLYRRVGLHTYSDADGSFKATIHSVAPTGHLVLQDSDGGLRRYAFKEVRCE